MAPFDLSDLDSNLTEEARLRIAHLILKWAAFDTAISYWMVRAFGIPMDTGSIILGNMDTKQKLDRLHALHIHFGHTEAASGIADIRNQHRKHVEPRNTVAHKRCAGVLFSEPTTLVFHSIKHIKGSVGEFEILAIPREVIAVSTAFAATAEAQILELADEMRRPISQFSEPRGE